MPGGPHHACCASPTSARADGAAPSLSPISAAHPESARETARIVLIPMLMIPDPHRRRENAPPLRRARLLRCPPSAPVAGARRSGSLRDARGRRGLLLRRRREQRDELLPVLHHLPGLRVGRAPAIAARRA